MQLMIHVLLFTPINGMMAEAEVQPAQTDRCKTAAVCPLGVLGFCNGNFGWSFQIYRSFSKAKWCLIRSLAFVKTKTFFLVVEDRKRIASTSVLMRSSVQLVRLWISGVTQLASGDAEVNGFNLRSFLWQYIVKESSFLLVRVQGLSFVQKLYMCCC